MIIENGWLKCRCSVDDRKLQELGIDQSPEWQKCLIKTTHIEGIRPNIRNGEEDGSIVYTIGGDQWVVDTMFDFLVEQLTFLG